MVVSRKSLFGKLDTTLFRAMESAASYAKLKYHPYVELGHWLWHFWQVDNTDLRLLAAHDKLDLAQIDSELRIASEQQPTSTQGAVDFGRQVPVLLERAWVHATLCRDDWKIRSVWLLEAALADQELHGALSSVSPTLARIVIPLVATDLESILRGSVEERDCSYDHAGFSESVPGESSGAIGAVRDGENSLDKYCQDLTEQARCGKLDPVIGRDHEIQSIVDILLRRRQNNPLLTGEAGVGKTAVVEGLAHAISTKAIPPALQNVRLLSLDVGALIAGASMRGEFEARLKTLLKQTEESSQPTILFIDEIHTLVGAGGQAGTGDAANLLKPALARGGLRTIGATTWGEYKKHIEKDPALTRRFQVLQVNEPDLDAAKAMLRALVGRFSEFHGVYIAQDGVDAAVELSRRYIPARQLPDKAISLLDTACARVSMSMHSEPQALLELRQRKLNLQTQLCHVEKERIRNPKQEKKFFQLREAIELVDSELNACLARWMKERELVKDLLERWSQADKHGEEQPDRDWHHIEQQLQKIQGDKAYVNPEVNAEVVANIVSNWTGIPTGRMLASEREATLGLESLLQERIKGQGHALKAIAERVRIAKSGLSDPEKPIGVFLLVGPSGVGKTETALALADAIYGGERNLITLNMSEFQESHNVSTLKGAPPGYVGYGEGGILTEAVRRKSYSVILLDEVEKAHPDVHEIFYQVFDKGWMEDGEGRRIDFRNTLILLTSNTGSEVIEQFCADEALIPSIEGLTQALLPELRKVFPAALLGRVLVTPYLPLTANVIAEITELQLNKVKRRVWERHHVRLVILEQALAQVQQATGSFEIGGRRIAQHIEREILPLLSMHWLRKPYVDVEVSQLLLGWEQEEGYFLTEVAEERELSVDRQSAVEKQQP